MGGGVGGSKYRFVTPVSRLSFFAPPLLRRASAPPGGPWGPETHHLLHLPLRQTPTSTSSLAPGPHRSLFYSLFLLFCPPPPLSPHPSHSICSLPYQSIHLRVRCLAVIRLPLLAGGTFVSCSIKPSRSRTTFLREPTTHSSVSSRPVLPNAGSQRQSGFRCSF